jgi:hypothetical protein
LAEQLQHHLQPSSLEFSQLSNLASWLPLQLFCLTLWQSFEHSQELLMRFLLSVIDSASRTGSTDEMAAIDIFNEKLQNNGHWIFACGVDSPKTAKLVDNRAGAGITQDGSYVDNDEFQSGFWIINAADHDEAMALALEGSKACNRKVEIRPLLG